MMNWLSKHIFFPLWEVKDGSHRLKYLKELSDSQWLDYESLRQRQWDRTCKIVKYAYENCIYYKSLYTKLGFDGVLRNWDDFYRLPLLTKSDIRTYELELLSKQFRLEDLVESKTGGSTGTALKLYCDKQCQELRNAAEMRSHYWAGRDIGTKFAAVWGNPPIMDTWKKKIRSLLINRILYLDTMSIDEKNVYSFIKNWEKEKPQVLFGHAHSIFILANYIRSMKLKPIRPQGIITTSMMLLDSERQIIENTFECKVTNLYGCEEVGLIGCECELHSGFHLNIDHLVIEFLNNNEEKALSDQGASIVVTDLINHGMPLIRYNIEDKGIKKNQSCRCGRGLPLMDKLVGRQADFLKKLDGSLVAGVSLVERTLTDIVGIEQMQLIQDRIDVIKVKIVKDKNFSEQTELKLKIELLNVFGPEVTIDIFYVLELDKTPTGKYRFSICSI